MMRSLWGSLIVLLGWSGLAVADAQIQVSDHAASSADPMSAALVQRTIARTLRRIDAHRTLGDAGIRSIDVTIVRVTTETIDQRVVVAAEIQVAISGDRGTMLSVLAGGARVETAVGSYRPAHTAQLHADAIGGAIEAVLGRGYGLRRAPIHAAPRARYHAVAAASSPARWLRATDPSPSLER